MDGASALNARTSYNKAYTATKWQRDTKAIKERLFDMSLGNDRREIAWFYDPLYTLVWGGIVLRVDRLGSAIVAYVAAACGKKQKCPCGSTRRLKLKRLPRFSHAMM